MKVIAFVGSPRKDGNTFRVINAICRGAKESGHETEIYNLFELKNQGCIACNACQANKVEYCSIDDNLTALLPKIAKADCLIFGTPIYMGHVSGHMKNFFDRLRPFMQLPDYTIKHLPGKKYITVTCSGAPAAAAKETIDYLDKWFSGFYKMENAGNLAVGGVRMIGDVDNQPDVMKNAEELGRKL